MKLKNYTSEVPAVTSMARIELCLIDIGASNTSKKYENKVCTGITFLHHDALLDRTICFHLKAQVQEAFECMWRERSTQGRLEKFRAGVMEQANRTAWKIIHDLVQVQCAMILLEQATALQLFLPYVYDPASDETLYQKIITGKANLLGPSK